ncbi:MAG: sulfatase-like hydrolase/transferase [Acidobacteria bacterium]|nr:sulfatase-like hydrolase/transferase [Acidobacteriota bacterium]
MQSCGAGAALRAQRRQRPNLVVILVDDIGRDWVGCYGARQRTPNIDKLARDGVRFDKAWSTPICTPTRVELLTGRYPFRTGWIDHFDVPRWGGKGLDWDREITFARMLRDAGYATVIGGKWQVNDFRTHPDALKRHGFDEHCMWTGFETGNPPSARRYWDAFLQINGERRVHSGKYGPDVVNAYLVDFVRRNRQKPFLLYYPMILVHGAYEPTPWNRSDPPKGNAALYSGMVSYADHLVGNIMQSLDEAGVARDTFVLFAGDNGSPMGGGSINGLVCPPGKGRITDLGAHVPFIARAPWLGTRGRVATELADFSDVLPTLAELAGIAAPCGVAIDGRSFVPVLTGASGGTRREWIYTQRWNKRAVRDARYKVNSDGSFFDLEQDPLEKNDLRSSTDSGVAAARRRLEAVLQKFPENGPPPFEGYAAGKLGG